MIRGLVALAIGCAAVLAGTAAASLVPRGTIHYVDLPTVQLKLPAMPMPAHPGLAPELAMLASPEPPREVGLPAPVDPALVERAAAGSLPRMAADGRTALRHYAHPTAPGCDRPCVGLIVVGLGLAERVTLQALGLPALVGLSFSPYADAAGWQARARRQGHEVLLDLPLEPMTYPRDDSGPLAVSTSPAALEAALQRVLAAGAGYVALAAEAGSFSGDGPAFAPVARLLRERGLGLVELGRDSLGGSARAMGLPYAVALGPVDADPSAEAVTQVLEGVEAAALAGRATLVFAQATPAGLDRLAAWLETLPARGLRLVPPSRFLDATSVPHAAAGGRGP